MCLGRHQYRCRSGLSIRARWAGAVVGSSTGQVVDKAARRSVGWRSRGVVAQLGERVVRNDEVSGSIPLGSTNFPGARVLDARVIERPANFDCPHIAADTMFG